MKPRFLLPAVLAGVAVCALAYALRLSPEPAAPDPPTVAAAPEPERPELRHRLADAEAALIRSVIGEASRRLAQPVSIWGGAAVSEAAPWYVRHGARRLRPSRRASALRRSSCCGDPPRRDPP